MNIDRVLSLTLTGAAIVVAGALVHREFFRNDNAGLNDELRPVLLKDWRGVGDAGIRMGDTAAPIQLVEFADFQCPVCKEFEGRVRQLMARHPGVIARTFVHYPLPMHSQARPAARVSECADAQHKFDEVVNLLYAKQDSFGVKSWASFGTDAHVPDQTGYKRCTDATDSVARIDAGYQLARRLELRGTPTVILDGWRFLGSPPDSVLENTIDDLLHNRKPRTAK